MKNILDRLGKFRDTVGHGINVATVNTGKFIDETKLRGRISSLEKQRSVMLEELGSIVYVSSCKGNLDQARVNAKVKEIVDIDTRIATANREIQELAAKAQEQIGKADQPKLSGAACACGAPIQPGSKFCTNCGGKIPA